jgi:hypothetical protein
MGATLNGDAPLPNGLARILYFVAIAEGALAILMALVLWPKENGSADACRALAEIPSAWRTCQAIYDSAVAYNGAAAIAVGIGGILSAMVLYALADILNRVTALQDRTDIISHRASVLGEQLDKLSSAKRERQAAPTSV